MTFTITSARINGKYIEVYQEKFSNSYKVSVSNDYGTYVGYPEKTNIYPTLEKAMRRFNKLAKEFA